MYAHRPTPIDSPKRTHLTEVDVLQAQGVRLQLREARVGGCPRQVAQGEALEQHPEGAQPLQRVAREIGQVQVDRYREERGG